MFGWLRGPSRRELQTELETTRAELASVKAASAGDVLASGGGGDGNFPLGSTSSQWEDQERLERFRGWTYSAIHCVASRAAGQAIRVGRPARAMRGMRAKGFTPPGIEPLDDHPLLTTLSTSPNALQTAWQAIYFTLCQLELSGRCLWYAPAREPLQVYPLPSSWITGMSGTTEITSFKIRPPKTAEEMTLPADECVWMYYPSPLDPRKAMSPLQASALAVTADEHIQQSQVAAFKNGVYPRHAVVIGDRPGPDGQNMGTPTLTNPQRRQIIDALLSVYRGSCRAGEPIIFDNLIKDLKPLTIGNDEMCWKESGDITKARILQAHGVNEICLGAVQDANRASATAAESHLASTLNPKLRLLGECLTAWLGWRYGGVTIWFEPYQPADIEMEVRKMQLLIQAGAVTGNELRQWSGFGLAPLDYLDAPVSIGGTVQDGIAGLVDDALAQVGARHTFNVDGGKENGNHSTLPSLRS